jgi:hypothetical protein
MPLQFCLPIRPFLVGCVMLAGCTFHSTATHWNGRLDPAARPIYLTTTTIVGINLLVLLPFLGDTRADNLLDAATAEIARTDSTNLRVVETESANYWFAVPPLTWLFTPVQGSVSIEYTPSATALAAQAELERLQEQRAAERRAAGQEHLIPEPRR